MALYVAGYGLDHVIVRDDAFDFSKEYTFGSNKTGYWAYTYRYGNLSLEYNHEQYFHAYGGDGDFKIALWDLTNTREDGTKFGVEQAVYVRVGGVLSEFRFTIDPEAYLRGVQVYQQAEEVYMYADVMAKEGVDTSVYEFNVLRTYVNADNQPIGGSTTFGFPGGSTTYHSYEDLTLAQGSGAKLAVYNFVGSGIAFERMWGRALETALDNRLKLTNIYQEDNTDGTYTVRFDSNGTGYLENSSGQFVAGSGNVLTVSKSIDEFDIRVTAGAKMGYVVRKESFLNLIGQVASVTFVGSDATLDIEYISEHVTGVTVYGLQDVLDFGVSDTVLLPNLTPNAPYAVYLHYRDQYSNTLRVEEYVFKTPEEVIDTIDVSVVGFDHNSVTFDVTKTFTDMTVTRNGYIVNLSENNNGYLVDTLLTADTEYMYVFSNASGTATKQVSVRTSVAPLVKYLSGSVDTVGKTYVVLRVDKNFDDFATEPAYSSSVIVDADTLLLRYDGLTADTSYDFTLRDTENAVNPVNLTVKTLEDIVIDRKIRVKLVDLTDKSVRFGVNLVNLDAFEVYRNGVSIDLTRDLDDDVYEDIGLVAETDYEYEFLNEEYDVSVTLNVRTERLGSGSETVDEGFWTAYVRKNIEKTVKTERLDGLVSAYEVYVSSLVNKDVREFGPDLKLCLVILTEEALNKDNGLSGLGMGDVSYSFSAETNQMFWNIVNSYRGGITINVYNGGGGPRR